MHAMFVRQCILKHNLKIRLLKLRNSVGVNIGPCVKFLGTILMKSNLISSWQVLTRSFTELRLQLRWLHQHQNLRVVLVSVFRFVTNRSAWFLSCIVGLREETRPFWNGFRWAFYFKAPRNQSSVDFNLLFITLPFWMNNKEASCYQSIQVRLRSQLSAKKSYLS